VQWNGALAANGCIGTSTITAQVKAGTAAGPAVSNQGTVSKESDNNNTNDATLLTDDPSVGGSADPTTFSTATAG
jgi:hypothetical protein